MAHSEDVDSLRRLAGLATPMAIRVAVTLGLPDRLRGDALSAEELADELAVDTVAVGLLLEHLATLGIVAGSGGGYRTTAYGENLCEDAGNGLAGLLRLDDAGGRSELAFVELAHTVATGEAGYRRRYGMDFWTDAAARPRLRESFDAQMVHRFRAEIPYVVGGVDWARFGTIIDVGGGRGELLAAILAAHPAARGRLIDIEPTAAGAADTEYWPAAPKPPAPVAGSWSSNPSAGGAAAPKSPSRCSSCMAAANGGRRNSGRSRSPADWCWTPTSA